MAKVAGGAQLASALNWLLRAGMLEVELSAYRGAAGLTGMAAAALFPFVRQRLGLHLGAAAGITLQFVCLAAGVAADITQVFQGGARGWGEGSEVERVGPASSTLSPRGCWPCASLSLLQRRRGA